MRWGLRKPRPDERERVLRGALWGLAATVAMTVIMAIDLAIGRAPGPRTFPILILGHLLNLHQGAELYGLALGTQLLYGTVMGIVFAFLARPMTLAKGIGLGAMLWFLMQIEFIPWLGWGDFAFEHGGGSLVYTLILHIIYGGVLGWLGSRDEVAHIAHFDDLGQLVR